MSLDINVISTSFIFNITVNSYLIKTSSGFILIDTAKSGKRAEIEKALHQAGCEKGDLNLIILTHGDFDHCGNAAYLREKFGTKITIHQDDSGMVENGDMFWNRNQPNFLVRMLMSLFFRLSRADRFVPDFYIKANDTLSNYGFDAQVIELPGHSKGSVGLLTVDGDLFCGDLLGNLDKPELWSIIDDPKSANLSVEKLKHYEINTVYPGHGKPFLMPELFKNLSSSKVLDSEIVRSPKGTS